jgi:hypothetical protein
MNTLSKRHIGYILGAIIALLLAAPLLLGSVTTVHAAALTGDELFGGAGATGEAFASDAGLGDAKLVPAIASIIRVAMGFLGIIAVIIILLGGFKWMTAAGNDEKVKEAKKLIVSGIIGLVIILSAYAIANFVITQITGELSGGAPDPLT